MEHLLATFEAAVDSLLSAAPRNSSKGRKIKEWAKTNFNMDCSVSHVTDPRAIGNRVSEQMRYNFPLVVFVCDNSVNIETLKGYVDSNTYSNLSDVLIIGDVRPYNYIVLLHYKDNPFYAWIKTAKNIPIEEKEIEENVLSNKSNNKTIVTEMYGKMTYTSIIPKQQSLKQQPFQQIFYGAPGTGKSHEIKEKTKGQSVIRTTFHPDSDYSTFVGCYKPTMSDEETRVVPVVVTSGISLDQNNGTYKERRITYKFVMQAFLKAYLGAWKKFADADSDTNPAIPSTLHFYASGAHYTITGIDANGITYNKKFQYPLTVNKIATAWNEIWKSGAFVMPSGRIPGRSLEQAVSQWIKDNIEDCTKDSLEEGLDAFKEEIVKTWVVVVSKGTQKYSFYANGDNELFPVSADATSKRTTLKEYYSGEKDIEDATEIKRKLVEKLAEYDADSFDNAWDKMTEAVKGNHDALVKTDITPAPQFLIIEEINRGNCAQIFGDLFQLLDRSDNGFSEYPIEADTDLQKEIARAFTEHKDYKLNNAISVDGAVSDYTSNYDSTLSEDIQNGRVLLLPPNLYIWATMNTSDQSLFPIDSAFKRRWDWVYIPIDTHKEDWYIKVNDKEYSWPSFLDKINDEVLTDETTEDKHLGFYFCKAEGNIISVEKFVSKVLFYLWNDVFKVYGVPEMLTKGDKNMTFHKFYNTDGTINETLVAKLLDNIGVEKKVKEYTTESASDETASATE